MKVLLVSEGKHETSGALQAIIDRIAGMRLDYILHPANDAGIQASHGVRGVGSRLGKRVRAFSRLALEKKCDAMVYLIDQDGQPERRRALDESQADPVPWIAQALGVAVETFDAWILADERALSRVLGRVVDRQPDPETVRDAKGVCKRLQGESSAELALREMYDQVCRHSDLQLLVARCPAGFAPFAERVGRLFNSAS